MSLQYLLFQLLSFCIFFMKPCYICIYMMHTPLSWAFNLQSSLFISHAWSLIRLPSISQTLTFISVQRATIHASVAQITHFHVLDGQFHSETIWMNIWHYFLFQLIRLHFNHWHLRSQPSVTLFPPFISILITQKSWAFQFDHSNLSWMSPIPPPKKIKLFIIITGYDNTYLFFLNLSPKLNRMVVFGYPLTL